jgi:hypothetical protein
MTQADDKTKGLIISEDARLLHPDLVNMISKSVSMDTDEKNYWLSVLSMMSDEQIGELTSILEDEAKKLNEIGHQYEEKLTEEEQKRLMEEREERKKQRIQEEAQHKAESEEQMEDLLDQLENL